MGGSVIRRRQLARELRRLREAAGYSLEAAAERLEWSTSKLSRIENGPGRWRGSRVAVHRAPARR